MGSWMGRGRPFGKSFEVSAFQAGADKAIVDVVASGNVDKFKYVLSDIAKVFAMGPTHATAAEVDKYFSKDAVVDLATALWNEVAAGNPPAVLGVSFPPFEVLDRSVALPADTPRPCPACVSVPVPGALYEQMRRAPVGPAVVSSATVGIVGTPRGVLESVQLLADGKVRAVGWGAVMAAPATPVRIELAAERVPADGTLQTKVSAPANVARPDVSQSHGVSGNHGFDASIAVPLSGAYAVYAYAVNEATGESASLAGSPKNVMVAARSAPVQMTTYAQPVLPPPPLQTAALQPAQVDVRAPVVRAPAAAPQPQAATPSSVARTKVLGMSLPATVFGLKTPWFMAGVVALGVLAVVASDSDEPDEGEDSTSGS